MFGAPFEGTTPFARWCVQGRISLFPTYRGAPMPRSASNTSSTALRVHRASFLSEAEVLSFGLMLFLLLPSCGASTVNPRTRSEEPMALRPSDAARPFEARPGSIANPSRSAAPSSVYRPGEAVEILFEKAWYRGRVLSVLPDGRYEVAYDGWSHEWNRVAELGALRPATAAPGREVTSIATLEAGTAVLILWRGSWWPGRVLETLADGVRVGYDGYDPSNDETVGLDRLRIADAQPHGDAFHR